MSDSAGSIRFILASRSPARLANFEEEEIEAGLPTATPGELAQVLATAKAEDVATKVQGDAIIVGCDSVFELDGIAYGKPGNEATAKERWQRMFGRAGTLHTGHQVIDTASGRRAAATTSTIVHMGTMSEQEMADYLASGEPLEVAGGFTLDGLGGAFVERIEGDPSNVVGISLPTLRHLLSQIGTIWTHLWSANR
jgi:septum formation protein